MLHCREKIVPASKQNLCDPCELSTRVLNTRTGPTGPYTEHEYNQRAAEGASVHQAALQARRHESQGSHDKHSISGSRDGASAAVVATTRDLVWRGFAGSFAHWHNPTPHPRAGSIISSVCHSYHYIGRHRQGASSVADSPSKSIRARGLRNHSAILHRVAAASPRNVLQRPRPAMGERLRDGSRCAEHTHRNEPSRSPCTLALRAPTVHSSGIASVCPR